VNKILVNRGNGPSLNIDTLADLTVLKSLFSEKPHKGCSHAALSVADHEVYAEFYCPECQMQGLRIISAVRFMRAGFMVSLRIFVLSVKSLFGRINAHDRRFLRAL